MFTIQMSSGFSGVHMGLVFANGTAQTDDAFLATRLKSKGYTVTAEKGAEGKKKGGKKDKEKAAPEAAPAPEPESTADLESSEPPDLPPLDNEGDE